MEGGVSMRSGEPGLSDPIYLDKTGVGNLPSRSQEKRFFLRQVPIKLGRGIMRKHCTVSEYARGYAVMVIALFMLALTLFALPGLMTAEAAEGPKGPVEITVGTGAGGTPDIIMRRVAKILGEEKIVEQPIVIQNRTGGSWMVAVHWVLGKKGGYDTLMGIAQPVLTTPIVQGLKNAYDQLVPIAMFVQGDLMLVAQ